jgi:hypothetical protein
MTKVAVPPDLQGRNADCSHAMLGMDEAVEDGAASEAGAHPRIGRQLERAGERISIYCGV